MPKDKRKHKRRSINIPVMIALDDGSLVECVVLDISETGAKLKLSNAAGVPDIFKLLFSGNGFPRRTCKVVRRATDEIAVSFEGRGIDKDTSTVVEV